MDNTSKFLKLYNELDDALRDRYHEKNKSISVISKLIRDLESSPSQNLKDIANKLNDVRVIRNTLIHELDMNSEGFISITDDTIKMLDEFVTYVKHPRTSYDISIHIEKVYYIKEGKEPHISYLVKTMRERGFTQIPYLDKNNVLLGVFSPNVLLAFLNDHQNETLENIAFKDIKDYLPIKNHFSETYVFIKESELSDNVLISFSEGLSLNKKIAMGFVTKNGQNNESILGIIVLKDLLN